MSDQPSSKAMPTDNGEAVSNEVRRMFIERMDGQNALEAADDAERSEIAHLDVSFVLNTAKKGGRNRELRAAFATHIPPGWSDQPPQSNNLSPTLLSPGPFRVVAAVLVLLACLTAGTLAVLEDPTVQSGGSTDLQLSGD